MHDVGGLNRQHAGAQVHAQAKAALRAGMEMLSQAEVGAALQIYFNLDALPQARLVASKAFRGAEQGGSLS
jgi:hypothetical protein